MTDPIRSTSSLTNHSAVGSTTEGATPVRASEIGAYPTNEADSAGVAQLVLGTADSKASMVASFLGRSSGVPAHEAPGNETPTLASWYVDKVKAETACLLPCQYALELAKLQMTDGGLAEKMLNQFVSGNAAPVVVDLNREFERNPQLRELLIASIETSLASRSGSGAPIEGSSGAVWVSQSDYGDSDAGLDQKRAFGGTFFEFSVTGTADNGGLAVTVNVADNYFWSPSDASRATRCLHECGHEMVATGAAVEFEQFGEGQLVVADPRLCLPMAFPNANNSTLEN